jgi:hypothetical protein
MGILAFIWPSVLTWASVSFTAALSCLRIYLLSDDLWCRPLYSFLKRSRLGGFIFLAVAFFLTIRSKSKIDGAVNL